MNLRPYLRPFIIALLGTVASIAVRANVSYTGVSLDHTHSIALSDGLSDLLVNTIFKDSKGYVWFGTERALDRFDGNSLVSYPIGGDNRLSKRVKAIAEDSRGNIFVGSSQGLYRLDTSAARLEQISPKTIDFSVNAIKPDGHGQLFISTRHGLFVYDETTGRLNHRLLVPDNMSAENNIIDLHLDGDRGLWMLTPQKLWYMPFTSESISQYILPSSLKATALANIGNTLYIATDGHGLLPFDKPSRAYGEIIPVGNGLITSVSATPTSELLVSTDGTGIFVLSAADGTVTEHISTSRGIRSNAAYSALLDSTGLLWVGYYQSGIDYTPVHEALVTNYTFSGLADLSGTVVRALAVDGDLTAVGTHDGLYIINEKAGTVNKIDKEQFGSNQIFTILALNGRFLVGTHHGGLYEYNPSADLLRRFGPDALRDESVFILSTDSKGNVWTGTSAGLYRFDGGDEKRVSIYTSANSQLPEGNVYEIFFDSTGRGWICTEKGMAVWYGEHLRSTGFPTGFPDKMKIRAIYEDSNHHLFFAPDRGELWISDLALSDFSPLNMDVSGRFTMVESLIEDNHGKIWLGTDKGLLGAESPTDFIIINNVGGKVNPVYTLCKPYKDAEGNIYMGSTEGLHRVNAEYLNKTTRREKSALSFTNLTTYNRSIFGRLSKDRDGNAGIKLDEKENELTVDISDFRFRPAEYFEVEYICEGIDQNWRITDGKHSIRYFDIPPGTYRLRVREPGNPSSEIALNIKKSAGFNWMLFSVLTISTLIILAIVLLILQRRRHSREISAVLTETPYSPAAVANAPVAAAADDDKPYKNTRLSDEECKRLYKKLEALMKADKPYINPSLKSAELARMVGTTSHALSFLFNQYLEKSYYDYINQYRVDEFKRLVAETDTSRYTLTALAERCGFSSRASFFRHFKAATGATPSEYLKDLSGEKPKF